MKFVVVLVGSLDEYSLMMLVNECFVNVVFTNRRGSRDGDVFNFLLIFGRCVITRVLSLTGIVVVVVTLLSFVIIGVVSLTGIIVGVVMLYHYYLVLLVLTGPLLMVLLLRDGK